MKNKHIGVRLLSIIIDFLLILLVCLVSNLIILKIDIKMNFMYHYTFVMVVFYSLFFCKDIINEGQSIGKRIVGLRIINDNKSNNKGKRVSNRNLILRNIFIFIWPLELLMIIINPEKRMADFKLKTKIIPCKTKNKLPIFSNVKQYLLTFVGVFIITLGIFYLILFLLNILTTM